MEESLDLTIIYEMGDDGYVIARIREVPSAVSQGKTQAEARENVLDALREMVLSFLEEGEIGPLPRGATTEPLHLTLAS